MITIQCEPKWKINQRRANMIKQKQTIITMRKNQKKTIKDMQSKLNKKTSSSEVAKSLEPLKTSKETQTKNK